jgi:hypothetical protein
VVGSANPANILNILPDHAIERNRGEQLAVHQTGHWAVEPLGLQTYSLGRKRHS